MSMIEDSIRRMIQAELEKEIDLAADRVAEEARKAVRARVGSIATQLINQVSFERMGKDLIIKVKIDDKL